MLPTAAPPPPGAIRDRAAAAGRRPSSPAPAAVSAPSGGLRTPGASGVRRESLSPRPEWRAKVEALGLDFHSAGGEPYWWEEACYAFSAAEIDTIEGATDNLHQLCLEAVDRIVAAGDLDRLSIPEPLRVWAAESWRRPDPALYGPSDP